MQRGLLFLAGSVGLVFILACSCGDLVGGLVEEAVEKGVEAGSDENGDVEIDVQGDDGDEDDAALDVQTGEVRVRAGEGGAEVEVDDGTKVKADEGGATIELGDGTKIEAGPGGVRIRGKAKRRRHRKHH